MFYFFIGYINNNKIGSCLFINIYFFIAEKLYLCLHTINNIRQFERLMKVDVLLIVLCLFFLIAFLYERRRRIHTRLVLQKETDELKRTSDIAAAILKSVHAFVLLIDRDFTVLKTNYYRRTGTKKGSKEKKVGDLLQCRNAQSVAGGCGMHELCVSCPIRKAITQAFADEKNFTDLETTMNLCISDNESIECNVLVSGNYLSLDGEDCMVLTVHDVTDLKRAERV